MTKYRVLSKAQANGEVEVGDIVYRCNGHDYGLCRDDERETGLEHFPATLKPDGGYPLFTIPRHDLERLED